MTPSTFRCRPTPRRTPARCPERPRTAQHRPGLCGPGGVTTSARMWLARRRSRALRRARGRLARRRLVLASRLDGLPLRESLLLLRVSLQQLRRLCLMLCLELLARLLGELPLVLGFLLLLQPLPLSVLLSGHTLLLLQMLPLENVVSRSGRGRLRRWRRLARMHGVSGARCLRLRGRRPRRARWGRLAPGRRARGGRDAGRGRCRRVCGGTRP